MNREIAKERILYGFYSEKQRKFIRKTFVYRTPKNKKVTVTTVTEDPEAKNTEWDDKIYLGRVTTWVETINDT